MKRTAYVLASALVVTLMLIPSCFGQNDVSLADAARAQRKDKQSAPKPVIDNDSLPREEHINVVGQQALAPTSLRSETAPSEQDSSANSDAQAKADDDKTKLTVDPNQSAGDREAVYGEWRKKIADQKDTITLLTREVDVLQREYRLRAAAMYADVGNRLRNANSWDKEDRDYKDKIEAKQKDLDRAKQQLSDMQDQARKAGIPSGVVE
ncbi:MAG TPA: hypothetical protein VF011_05870 [Terriglobales bacterium]